MMLYSYSYSIPYIIVILILFYLAYKESKSISDKKKNILINIASLLLIFFFGLRGFIQSDFQNYYPWFENLPTLWNYNKLIDTFAENYEPGFVLFTVICKSIFPNYFIWVFICVLIDIIFLRKIFKEYSSNVCLSFAIYFAIGAIIMEFNLMRNIKAILILIFATKYIREQKMWKYFFCVLIAMLFHITSIIFIPLYFVLNKKWPKPFLICIFILCLAVLFLRISFLPEILLSVTRILGGEYAILTEEYFDSGALESSYGISFGLIERVITFFLVFYYYGRWTDKTGNKYIYLNMFIIYFMCFSLLAEMSVLLERFAYYFALSYCIFYPNIFKLIRSSNSRIILGFFIFLIFSLKVAQQTRTIVCKYDNLLFGIESFEERLITLQTFNTRIR